jgi:hypothetical protein
MFSDWIGETLSQSLPFKQLCDDVVEPVLRSGVMEDDDVGMVDGRSRPPFLLEASNAIGIG